MAKIDKFIIERILDAARIEEVVGDFVDLQKMLPSVKRKIDTLSTPQPADTSATDSVQ